MLNEFESFHMNFIEFVLYTCLMSQPFQKFLYPFEENMIRNSVIVSVLKKDSLFFFSSIF